MKFIASSVVIVLLAAVIAGIVNSGDSNLADADRQPAHPDPLKGLRGAAMITVDQVLNDPDSAQYPPKGDPRWDITQSADDPSVFNVAGEVSSKNAFGGRVRTLFMITCRRRPDDTIKIYFFRFGDIVYIEEPLPLNGR